MKGKRGGPYGNKYGWKTGEAICNGYIYLYSPNHPNRNKMGKGYVKRSRLMMENKIGRYLKKTENVHHINGIRDDDRIENLTIKTRSEHLSLHHKGTSQQRDNVGRFTKGGGVLCQSLQL